MSDEEPRPAVDGVCGECGFDYDALGDEEVVAKLAELGRRYRAPLTRGLKGEDLDAVVRARPAPEVWSALEYACHVRDVLAAQRGRLAQAQVEDVPAFTPMGRDELVVTAAYNEQDPAAVADELAANAEALAAAFAELDPAGWERRAMYGYPEPTERDMRWMGRHTVHEGHHHLLDVGRSLRSARGR
jgi:DNA segregation ATPase FtsK/SpoIIIE, S-DNA-T family